MFLKELFKTPTHTWPEDGAGFPLPDSHHHKETSFKRNSWISNAERPHSEMRTRIFNTGWS